MNKTKNMSKKTKDPQVKYDKLDQISHCLKRPDTYVGSVAFNESTKYVLNKKNNHIKSVSDLFNDALAHIFVEILDN